MSTISAVAGAAQHIPPPVSPPVRKPADNDEATESPAVKAKETNEPQRLLNVTA